MQTLDEKALALKNCVAALQKNCTRAAGGGGGGVSQAAAARGRLDRRVALQVEVQRSGRKG